jgi:hypothetical protein
MFPKGSDIGGATDDNGICNPIIALMMSEDWGRECMRLKRVKSDTSIWQHSKVKPQLSRYGSRIMEVIVDELGT